MTIDEPIDDVIRKVASMDRAGCIARLRAFRQPRLDFTDEFLAEQSLERLRHLVVAACIQAQRGGPADAVRRGGEVGR